MCFYTICMGIREQVKGINLKGKYADRYFRYAEHHVESYIASITLIRIGIFYIYLVCQF